MLGGLDAARHAGLEGFSGPLAAFLLLARHPVNPLRGVSGDSAAQKPGTRKRVLRKGLTASEPPSPHPADRDDHTVWPVMSVSFCHSCFSPPPFQEQMSTP